MTSHKRSIPEPRSLRDYVPSGSVDSSPETSSTCRSGGLGVARDTTCVQGLVRNSPFNHTIEVNSPPCRVTKEGRAPESSLQLTRPHGAFGSVGVALACAWPEASSTSSSATSKRRFRWRIRYLGFCRSSADGHRTV